MLKANIEKPDKRERVFLNNATYLAAAISIRTQIKISAAFLSIDDAHLRSIYLHESLLTQMEDGKSKYIVSGWQAWSWHEFN